MDLSKFKTSDWLKIGGGLAVLIFGFVAYSGDISGFGGEDTPDGASCTPYCDGPNMFDHFFTGVVPWILILAIAVLTFLAAAEIFKLPASFPAPLVFLAASGLALLLVLIRLLIGPEFDLGIGAIEYDRGVGMFIVVAGAILVFLGCLTAFKESGGNLNDFKDMNKVRGQFGGSGGGTPPPPSGMSPPPPPPPGGGNPPPPPPPGG